jgi:hypothetical protein
MSDELHFSSTVRRIVTGHDEQGNSVVLSDAPAPRTSEVPGARFWEVWSTDRAPALIQSKELREPTDRPLALGSPAEASYGLSTSMQRGRQAPCIVPIRSTTESSSKGK